MLLCQVTDTHIVAPGSLLIGRIDTAAHLARAVAHILALDPRPDAIVATGDLTDRGTPEEYAHFRTLMAPLEMPVFLIPGNHDARAPLRAAFPDHAWMGGGDGPIHYAIEDLALRLVAIDTTIPGEAGGRMDADGLAWLDRTLSKRPDRPTVVLMHHPPFPTGLARMDQAGLAGGEDAAAVVRRHPQVERVLCGHLHRPIQLRWAGTVASTAPSPAHQIALDLRPEGPLRWIAEPPAVQLHHWRPGVGLVSHTSYVGDYGPPQSFRAS